MVTSGHDRQLEDAILSAFSETRLAEIETLRVLVVDGVAYIDGCVGNYRVKKTISRLAAATRGLRKVVNRSRVVPAALVRDEALAEMVRRAIESHPSLKSQTISVHSRDCVIELSGTVERPSLRLQAEDVLWSVSGVRQVVNKLQISYGRVPEEEELARYLEQHLQSCLGLEPWQVSVQVERGIAHLRGKVLSRSLLDVAEELVRWHPRISDVINHLLVEETPSRDCQLTAS